MHFSLSMTPQLTQRMTLDLEQRLEMLQTCQMKMTETIEQLRDSVSLDRDSVANTVFAGFLLLAQDTIRDPVVFEMVHCLFSDKGNIEYLKLKTGDFAAATVHGFADVTRRALIDGLEKTSNGKVFLSNDSQSTSIAAFIEQAFKEPEKMEREIHSTTELARENSLNVGAALVESIGDMQNALTIAKALEPQVGTMQKIIELAFRVKDSTGKSILTSFFRESAILQSLDWELSDRITRRFVSRFAHLSQSAAGFEYRDAMANTISEFVLVSLGVLDPSLFKKMSNQIKELDVLLADQHVDETSNGNQDLVATLKKYKLAEKGPIYWSRWALSSGTKLNAMTDNLVRDFMRVTVANDRDELLASFGFDPFLARLKEIKKNQPREDHAALFAEALTESLDQEEFLNYLKQKSATDWFPKLNRFLYKPAD